MHPQDGFAAAHIRAIQNHAAVKASGPGEGRVQNIGSVGGRQYNDSGIGIEAIHFDQNLVEGLFALVVAAPQARAPVPPNGINFVHKNNARAVALGLVEQIAHPAGTDTDKHLDKFGPGNAEERHTGLACDGLGQQCFAGARAAHQQHAFGDARP